MRLFIIRVEEEMKFFFLFEELCHVFLFFLEINVRRFENRNKILDVI